MDREPPGEGDREMDAVARWPRPVGVRTLTERRPVEFEATTEERAAIALALGLVSLEALAVNATIEPWRGEGVRLMGTVRAKVTQECVVTLEPVPGSVAEDFDVRLHPDAAPTREVAVDPEAPDPPEPLTGYEVDVGEIALQHFILGLDPYPRREGAAFETPAEEESVPSPFAALADLARR